MLLKICTLIVSVKWIPDFFYRWTRKVDFHHDYYDYYLVWMCPPVNIYIQSSIYFLIWEMNLTCGKHMLIKVKHKVNPNIFSTFCFLCCQVSLMCTEAERWNLSGSTDYPAQRKSLWILPFDQNYTSLSTFFLLFGLSLTSANWPHTTPHCWTGRRTWMCSSGWGSASPGPLKEGMVVQNRCSFFHLFLSHPFPLSSPHTC